MLDSDIGLTSASLKEQGQYNYRGDVHAYWNYRIVSGCIQLLSKRGAPPESEQIQFLKKIGAKIGQKVLGDYLKEGRIYAQWTAQGKGK